MGLLDRPYAPTWQQNRQVYRYTPDAIVYVNGSVAIDGCPMCNQQIELQKYITTISVDSTTDPVSSASISLVVPKHASDVFGSDGNWILQPGLEIVVLFRGYFSQTNLVGQAIPENPENSENLQDVAMYPYYQVFRGVVKDVSHDFSGGFYSATLSCADILHFWQHLYLSTQGAVFGPRPDNAGVYVDLSGHSFTGLSPFSIIYTLVRAGFGAAFGVEYKLSQKTNFSDPKGRSYKHDAEAWAARWEENSGNLRMYGIDGSVFTNLEQAYLGVFQSGSKGRVSKLIKSLGAKLELNTRDLENTSQFKETMRKLGYNRSETAASVTASANGKYATVDMLAMMVYANDLGTLGSVNFFNSEMMSKLEIANAVTALTGYEFYQDVDGDLVFKPPFYNLDTSDDPYYVIEDRDLISINESSTEPEATMIKGTGSHFQNWKGMGTDDWMGVGATYVDFRLVAQFGWREGGAFETTYLTDPRSIFVAAINRLDLANLGMHTASITIPMRPELRPGYPIYIKHLDCFYYIKGLSHSFSFGGQCTTVITGVARRRKWFPPIAKSGDGQFPTLDNIRLDEPGKYSAAPIFVDPKNVGTGTQISGPTRMIGFPNVILALDSGKLDVGSIPVATLNLTAVDQIIGANSGVFTKEGEAYTLRGPQGSPTSRSYNKEELLAAFNLIRDDAITSVYRGPNEAQPNALANLDPLLATAFQNSPLGNNSALRNERELAAWVSLNVNLRSLYAPGNDLRGQYRYYSSSHEAPEFQGPKTLVFTDNSPPLHEEAKDFGSDGTNAKIPTLLRVQNGVGVQMRTPVRGVRIAAYGSNSGVGWRDVQTGDVRQVAFSPHRNDISTTEEVLVDAQRYAIGFGIDKTKAQKAMASLLNIMASREQPSRPIGDRFKEGYGRLSQAFDNLYTQIIAASPGLADALLTGPRGSCLEQQAQVTFESAKTALADLPEALTALGIPADAIVTGLTKYVNKDKLGVAAISAQLAAPYAILTAAFFESAKNAMSEVSEDQSESVITLMYRAKVTFERNLGMPSVVPVGGGTTKSQKKKSSKTVYTPVFPVSDAGGYEVYGGMPYGRGMTLTENYKLFDGIGASARSADQANDEIALLLIAKAEANPVALFAKATSKQKAVLAAAGFDGPDDLTAEMGRQLQRKGLVLARNKPLDSGDLDQAMSGANAAINLARINSSASGACACKNADASFFLEAASRDFAPVTEHAVQEWVTEQVLQTGVTWEQSKNAMAGEAAHAPTDYVEQSKAFLQSVGDQFSNGRDAISRKAKEDKKAFESRFDENKDRIITAAEKLKRKLD